MTDVRPPEMGASHSIIRVGGVVRLVLILTPQGGGSLVDQVAEVIEAQRKISGRQSCRMFLPTQTVFLRDAADQAACEHLFAMADFHQETVTHYVVQPLCGGARLAVEAWAVGGPGVTVERLSPKSVVVGYDGIRWVHLGGIQPTRTGGGVYAEAMDVFQQTGGLLAAAGLRWEQVARTWWQLGSITGAEGNSQRYLELNRARAEAFAGWQFGNGRLCATARNAGYPASTGIGMEAGTGLTFAGLALETQRSDVKLLPLENPVQTPAYDYAARYSPHSPMFSRAMVLVTPDYLTTWVSGTASIVNSEVCHPGDVVAQTELTIDNIATLMSAENFSRNGLPGGGAALSDLAKVRVYLKPGVDYAACRAVCERRLGNIPAIYVMADICRPELLVEIEGVAFSQRQSVAPVR